MFHPFIFHFIFHLLLNSSRRWDSNLWPADYEAEQANKNKVKVKKKRKITDESDDISRLDKTIFVEVEFL
jgi:hypothetical protein